MGFLKKSKVPGELPDLAINKDSSPNQHSPNQQPGHPNTLPPPQNPPKQVTPEVATPKNSVVPVPTEPQAPRPLIHSQIIPEPPKREVRRTEIAGEDYLEFANLPEGRKVKEDIRKQISETINSESDPDSFFDKILEDINGEIEDLGKLEEWYEKKFLPQDVVSNMRNYWEDNKADMIIRSFGGEYKQKINERIKKLQGLEEDWREIYFRLVKKEEEMKKEERVLKETLSEFVDLCKRRKTDGKKKESQSF